MDHIAPRSVHGEEEGGGGKGIFIFQLISSFEMSRGRFFGVVNSNLEEIFGSPPSSGGVPGGGVD